MRLAVFASGSGSNFQAILDARDAGELAVDVALLVSNRPDAGALDRATAAGVDARVLDPGAFADEASYCGALRALLDDAGITFIALAGYLRKVPSAIIDAYRGRIVNIHPALLPAFGGRGMYGLRVHRAVLDHGARWSGATVHLVDEEYDSGPIVLQTPVPVLQDDTPESLAARVLAVEHRLYPHALRLFAEGRVRQDGRRIRIDGLEPAALVRPAAP